jgi:hypothetical protein
MLIIGPILPPLQPANQLLLELLRKLLLVVPVVVAPRVLQLIDDALNPETPAWKRALLVSIALEVLALVQVSVPAGAALRCALLASLFRAEARARHKDDAAPGS